MALCIPVAEIIYCVCHKKIIDSLNVFTLVLVNCTSIKTEKLERDL
jgi:hypothetical protein